ncbi:hypothetical protein C9374_008990 [Naegleria lovaniensis]|uniref:Uncharacterized protein n=1 Tax=Naegleria lovaniensis TaxID=51637 RepID=A0AA88KFL5_NAELO|nr:uncharacterized protein C9374_008990 [Naegleria lovaniensis]KAG2377905.1 hypothetical protein C9374_008990 [Naegleria lovaniensis]
MEEIGSNRDWTTHHWQETSALHQADMNAMQYIDLLQFVQDNNGQLLSGQNGTEQLRECFEQLSESNGKAHYIDRYEDYLDAFSYDERPDENIGNDIQLEDSFLDFESLNSSMQFFAKEVLSKFDAEYHSALRKDLLDQVVGAKSPISSLENEMYDNNSTISRHDTLTDSKHTFPSECTLDNSVDIFSNLECGFCDFLLPVCDHQSELECSLYSIVDISGKSILEFDVEFMSASYKLVQCDTYRDYLRKEMSGRPYDTKEITDINSLLPFEEKIDHEQISSEVHEIENINCSEILEERPSNIFITELQKIAIPITQEQKRMHEFWCLDSKDQEIYYQRNTIHFIDTIINTDDVKTIPNPPTEVFLPKCDNIIPIEKLAKPKPTTNIEITLSSLWLSDKIYLFRKEIDKKECAEPLPASTDDTLFKTPEEFSPEVQYSPDLHDIYLNVPSRLRPSSESRLRTERLEKALYNLEIAEKEFEHIDILFIQEMFKQTSLYANTVSHYKDDGKGALYQYESLLENLLTIEEFEEYGRPNKQQTGAKSRITKNHSKLEELVEESLESFMVQKKANTCSTTQKLSSTLEKSASVANTEDSLFIPDDIRVSKETIDIVTDIQSQNSLLVLPSSSLRPVIGLLLLQKLKKCSTNSNFIYVDSNEKRLEDDFRFYSSYLWNHTNSLIMVTKENFTFQLAKINTNCKFLFLSSHIMDNFIQRFEKVVSNCSFIFYQDSTVATLPDSNEPSTAQVSICKALENIYAISKKTVHSIVASYIPARSVNDLINLLDSIISKRVIIKGTYNASFHKEMIVELDGPISTFLCDLIKIGEFTMSGISGVKGYELDTMKFVEVDSEYIKHIVEDFGAGLKVVIASNDHRRISETKSVFKKLVCLHTLKCLYEIVLDGGVLVGLSFLEKIKQSDTYNTILEGSISDILIRLKALQEQCSRYESDSHMEKFKTIEDNILEALEAKNNVKILFITKHNKVLTLLRQHLQSKFSDRYQIKFFSLIIGEKDTIFMRDAALGAEEPKLGLSEELRNNSLQFHFVTYSMLEKIKERRSFEVFSGFLTIVQVEPGNLPPTLYSLVSRCMVESWVIHNVLPSVMVSQDLFKRKNFVEKWCLELQGMLKTDSSIIEMEDLTSVAPRMRNISLLTETDWRIIADSYLRVTPPKRKSAIKIIATEKCIQNSDLISELEARFLVSVVERTFVNHAPADMIINDRHCALLGSCENLSTEDALREETINLFSKVLHLSHQFSYCWIILEKYLDFDNYENALGEIDSMVYLATSLLSFTKSLSGIEVNVKMSYSMDQTAEIISTICNDVKEQSKTLNKDVLWIRERETEHEGFLAQFPFISYYSAQAILQNYTLKQIASFRNYDEFAHHLGTMVPERILHNFYQCFTELFDGYEENANTTAGMDDDEIVQTSQILVNQGSHTDHSFHINKKPLFHQDPRMDPLNQAFMTPPEPAFSYPVVFGKSDSNSLSHSLQPYTHVNSAIEEPLHKKAKPSTFPSNQQTPYIHHIEFPPPSPLFQQKEFDNSFSSATLVKPGFFQGAWASPNTPLTSFKNIVQPHYPLHNQFSNGSPTIPFNFNSKKIQTPRPGQSTTHERGMKFFHNKHDITTPTRALGASNKMPKNHLGSSTVSTPSSNFRYYL